MLGVGTFISPSNQSPSFGVAYDTDAQAFITASGITDNTQKSAINTLVLNLKSYSIWTKMYAVYPFVGGTTSTHKWNLKDPRDLDAAFRLTFHGNASTPANHTSSGFNPGGTNGYANTYLRIVTDIGNTHSWGIYSTTNSTSGTQVYGAWDGGYFNQNNLSAGTFVDGGQPAGIISYTANPSTSLLMATRRSATEFQAYRGGVSLGTQTSSNTNFPNYNFYLGARNDLGTANLFGTHNHAFAFLGGALTTTDCSNLYTAVQAFQTTLSRQV